MPRPTPRPVQELTPEQQRQWQEDSLRRLIDSIEKKLNAAIQRIQTAFASRYGVPSSYMRDLSWAQASIRAIQPLARAQGDMLEAARALKARLEDEVMMSARGAHNSGDLNTTCAWGRAEAAADLSARADLHRELRMILGA